MKKLSLTVKYLLLLIPLFAFALITSAVTWQSLGKRDSRMTTANRLNELSGLVRLYPTIMGSGLRGYLLDPKNEKEAKSKQQADEDLSKILKEMSAISADGEIKKLLNEIEEFDDKNLNPAEDKVVSLVKEGKVAEGQKAFTTEYLPLRELYDDLSKAISEKTSAEAKKIIVSLDEEKQNTAVLIICVTLLGVVLVASLMLILTFKVSGSIRNVVVSLSEASKTITNTATQISDSSENLSHATSTQAASLTQTAAAVEQTNAMILKNNENSKSAARNSSQSQTIAEKGQQSVQNMIKSMVEIDQSNQDIIAQVNKSNAQVSEIVKVISEIGDKTKVINDIVFQTKLLSFNASVEAARAGEQGKGFAVVADEVGKLAAMSGTAAKEITDMLEQSIKKVQSIVADTNQSVTALITKGEAKVRFGTTIANECGEALNEIVESISSVTSLASDISSASLEQSKGVEEINKAIAEIDRMTQENANASAEAAKVATLLTSEAISLEQMVIELVATVEGKAAA